MKRSLLALAFCIASVVVLSACGGGGKSSGDKTATAAASGGTRTTTTTASATTKTGSPAASKTGAVVANTPVPGSTAAAVATEIANTPGAAETLAASGATPDVPGSTPGPSDAGTPAPGTTVAPGSTVASGPPTVADAEATLAADIPPEVYGGDPHDPPHVIGNVPAPPAGASVDSRDIAAPNPPNNTRQLIIDMNASAPGIQSTRDVKVGDVIRVAIVVVDAPVYQNNTGGVSAVQFTLNYDRTKILAPTIEGGSSTDRNPDLNTNALDNNAQWACLPAAQGDLDDPNGIPGDGDPATGQAFLSCFTPGIGHESGTLVLATVEFHATATGTSTLSLTDTAITDVVGFGFNCEGDSADNLVPCQSATINVR